ncbi:glucose-1-phosphate adenylyltransferase [Proteus genomosp. 6]|uniref:Glucose-1-phosphate adenylyltransferase n=1 Tax=Proteus genomosp. 6 TaxID=1311820 RepID=A0ABV1L589_9GAMM
MITTEQGQKLMLAQQLPKEAIALVLAGGRGTRLKALTSKRAKPAVFFGGKFRIIDFTLSNCLNSGIRRIGVITQYQSHSLVQHIQRGWSFFNEDMNEFVDLLPAQQRRNTEHWYMGTADAIYQNLDILRSYKAKYVVILAGDHIYKMNYARLLLDHVENKSKFTVACIRVPKEDAFQFGIMDIDENRRVLNFLEKPSNPPCIPDDPDHSLASMGIYVVDRDYLFDLLEEDSRDPNSHHDFGQDIIPKITERGDVLAHPFELSCVSSDPSVPPYWRDVGTIEAYWAANLDLASVTPELDMYAKDWPIRTFMTPLPPAKFVQDNHGEHGQMMNSLIADGCIINGSTLYSSILFPLVRVESFCHIEDSVILPDVTVSHHCYLKRCIIERSCTMPEGTVIGMNAEEDAARFHRTEEGIVLVTREMLEQLARKEKENPTETSAEQKPQNEEAFS